MHTEHCDSESAMLSCVMAMDPFQLESGPGPCTVPYVPSIYYGDDVSFGWCPTEVRHVFSEMGWSVNTPVIHD